MGSQRLFAQDKKQDVYSLDRTPISNFVNLTVQSVPPATSYLAVQPIWNAY